MIYYDDLKAAMAMERSRTGSYGADEEENPYDDIGEAAEEDLYFTAVIFAAMAEAMDNERYKDSLTGSVPHCDFADPRQRNGGQCDYNR